MKKEEDYIRDISEIRSMMERSSKFLTLSGWAGIMAGIYALFGAWIAHRYLIFEPSDDFSSYSETRTEISKMLLLGILILALAMGTAVYFSYRNAQKKGEKLWNPTSRRLLIHMAVPLCVGGILILILISKGFAGLMAPLSLIFYGLALYNASKFTYEEIRLLGLVEIILGLIGVYFIGYGLLLWALGFGIAHIIYGIYMHYKYEK